MKEEKCLNHGWHRFALIRKDFFEEECGYEHRGLGICEISPSMKVFLAKVSLKKKFELAIDFTGDRG